MFDLPINTHRYLIQHLSNGHFKQIFVKRFLKFCDNLEKCIKLVIRDTFAKVKDNVRTTTGKNLAELSILLNKPAHQLSPCDASDIVLAKVDDEQKYRVDFIKELLDIRHGNLEVDGFSHDELEMLLEYLCVS